MHGLILFSSVVVDVASAEPIAWILLEPLLLVCEEIWIDSVVVVPLVCIVTLLLTELVAKTLSHVSSVFLLSIVIPRSTTTTTTNRLLSIRHLSIRLPCIWCKGTSSTSKVWLAASGVRATSFFYYFRSTSWTIWTLGEGFQWRYQLPLRILLLVVGILRLFRRTTTTLPPLFSVEGISFSLLWVPYTPLHIVLLFPYPPFCCPYIVDLICKEAIKVTNTAASSGYTTLLHSFLL